MTKKTPNKKEIAATVSAIEDNSNANEMYNNSILLEKILEACVDIKKSVDALAERFGGGY